MCLFIYISEEIDDENCNPRRNGTLSLSVTVIGENRHNKISGPPTVIIINAQ